jgi:anthranilate phosphoribosyltransferase
MSIIRTIVEVMKELGAEHIMAVHGSEGLDEISISGHTSVVELHQGQIKEYEIHPMDFNITPAPINTIQTSSCSENIDILNAVLDGQPGPHRDIVLLNSAAAIRISGKVDTLDEGIAIAAQSIDSGAAKNTLQKLIKITNSDLS